MRTPSSRLAFAVALAFAACIASPGAWPGPAAPSPVASAALTGVLVDAHGTVMGPYYPYAVPVNGQDAAVLLSLAGRNVLVPLHDGDTAEAPDNMVPGTNAQTVFFESSDCSGRGWLTKFRSPSAGVAAAAVISTQPDAVSIYLPSADPPQQVTTQSALANRGSHKAAACELGGAEGAMRKVEQVIVLSTIYQIPYHLQ